MAAHRRVDARVQVLPMDAETGERHADELGEFRRGRHRRGMANEP